MPLPLGSHVYAKPRPSSSTGEPLDLWADHQKYTSLLLQHFVLRRNRAQLRPVTQPEHTPMQPLGPLLLMHAVLSTSSSRTPTHTASASDIASVRATHHPTSSSAATTGPTDQFMIISQSMTISKLPDFGRVVRPAQRFHETHERVNLCLPTVSFFICRLFKFFFQDRGMSRYTTLLFCVTPI